MSHNSEGGLGSGGWGFWGRWAVLADRWAVSQKDVEKAKVLLEFVSCGGNLNPEQHLKALGIHKSCFQTPRREMGMFHKNCPESLDSSLKMPLSIVSLRAHTFLPRGIPSYHLTRACFSPRACAGPSCPPGPLTACLCWPHSSSLPLRCAPITSQPALVGRLQPGLAFICLAISFGTSCLMAFFLLTFTECSQ